MKKNFLAIATCLVSLLLINSKSNAQGETVAMENVKNIKINHSVFPDLKGLAPMDASTINVKAIKSFKRSYKSIGNEQWSKIADGFAAFFDDNGVSNVIYYDKKGNWAGDLKGYHEDHMNKDVRDLVKSTYFDYKINYVNEVQTPENVDMPVYIVHIQGNNEIKLIRVCDGAMDVYQEFKTQQ